MSPTNRRHSRLSQRSRNANPAICVRGGAASVQTAGLQDRLVLVLRGYGYDITEIRNSEVHEISWIG